MVFPNTTHNTQTTTPGKFDACPNSSASSDNTILSSCAAPHSTRPQCGVYCCVFFWSVSASRHSPIFRCASFEYVDGGLPSSTKIERR